MPLMSTCLGRLGSRFSLILDPIRRCVHYGALGLMCQSEGELVIALIGPDGREQTLPLCRQGEPFLSVDQHQTMTSLRFEAWSVKLGVKLIVRFTAPFWPEDERTSLLPAYIIEFTIERSTSLVRWNLPDPDAPSHGSLQFGLKLPGASIVPHGDGLRIDYPVRARDVFGTTGDHVLQTDRGPVDNRRQHDLDGQASDRLAPLEGEWHVDGDMLRVPFDVRGEQTSQSFALAMVGYCGDPLFERFGHPMPLKYTTWWQNADEVANHVRDNRSDLLRRSRAFDAIWQLSPLPVAARDLSALAFQSYLMNTIWCVRDDETASRAKRLNLPGQIPPWHDHAPEEWFSVWEGTCWFNSTVDVTYNEAMFYFACWPRLLELLLDQWSWHVNDLQAEKRRRDRVTDDDEHGNPLEPFPEEGAILEHDMGAGWSANGQNYWHAMPVEENSNFLLLLFAHVRWHGDEALWSRYEKQCRQLVTYLLWCDSTGNGFPDRGCANTIDDANPAVQYGRDNVYLGVKRLAALHAASRIFEYLGDAELARQCQQAVENAAETLNAGWLGDHWPVALDRSARGLVNNRTGKPLPYDTLPGWDAYSLYTANGLLYLLMTDDLPEALDTSRLHTDLLASLEHCTTHYGCSHSSEDPTRVWISMNLWRDCVAAYLGENLLTECERYWNQQLFANGPGGDKANCFTETSMTNNLVMYPRGAAAFGLLLAGAGLVIDRITGERSSLPVQVGRWPLLPLCDWEAGRILCLEVPSDGEGQMDTYTLDQLAHAAAENTKATENYTTALPT